MGLEILSAGLNYHASKKAAKAQEEAAGQASEVAKESTDKQLELMRQIWEQQQKDQKPYLQQGTWGINRLGDLMRNQTPAYNSRGKRKPTPNANGGQLNNPFDSYLASKGVSNKFDSSNTRLDNLMKQGQGQLNNPFDSYLASKGLAGGKFDTSNPAYQFQLKQGMQALERSAASRGRHLGGAQLKALNEYGQGLASQQYDKEYNRALGEFGDYYRMAGNEYDRANQQYTNEYNRANNEFADYFNRLASLSQGGQQAAQSLGGIGSNYSANAANTLGALSSQLQNNIGQGANARASGYIGKANAIGGGIQQMTDNAFRLASILKPNGF